MLKAETKNFEKVQQNRTEMKDELIQLKSVKQKSECRESHSEASIKETGY